MFLLAFLYIFTVKEAERDSRQAVRSIASSSSGHGQLSGGKVTRVHHDMARAQLRHGFNFVSYV